MNSNKERGLSESLLRNGESTAHRFLPDNRKPTPPKKKKISGGLACWARLPKETDMNPLDGGII